MGGEAGDRCHIMLSAAGRRVALLRLFEQSLDQLNLTGDVIATDITAASPAYQAAQHRELVPSYRDPGCLDALLALCQRRAIRLIVPTIDPDLPFYAEHRERFAAIGTHINISSLDTIRIAGDKRVTHDWLTANELPTVGQCAPAQVLDGEVNWPFPLFVKPRRGAAGIGAMIVHDKDELAFAAKRHDCIVQTIARGDEYTTDVFVDDQGVCRCAVPRKRLETRAGEVSKGMTVRCDPVRAVARAVAEALPGARGVMNIQVFHDAETGAVSVNEINPRFGGGYPLAHHAGAAMTQWLIEPTLGQPCSVSDDTWRDGCVMLRYDEAVFVSADQAGLS